MTANPKLIEAVARALAATNATVYMGRASQHYIDLATAALSAINASGEWWIAPVDLSTNEAMWAALRRCATGKREEWDEFTDFTGDAGNWNWLWHELRTAYLAKTEETAK